MDVLSNEMEEDRKEEKEYQLADERQKQFMEWRQVWDAVKYCLIVVALFLVLSIQIASLFSATVTEGIEQKLLSAIREGAKSATDVAVDYKRLYVEGVNDTTSLPCNSAN